MLSDEQLQNIAREFNQAETAFIIDEGDEFLIRWFSPTREADLCGHATLAAAHVLWEFGELTEKTITFKSRGGELFAKRKDGKIVLNFPATECAPCITPNGLADAIGTMPFGVCKAGNDLLVEVGSADAVRDTTVNLELLKQMPIDRGLILCAEHDSDDYDIICRFFAPKMGIDEDQVTGSAHCALGPYFSKRFPDRKFLRSFQASPRGGTVHVQVKKDRAHISGHACTVCVGTLHL